MIIDLIAFLSVVLRLNDIPDDPNDPFDNLDPLDPTEAVSHCLSDNSSVLVGLSNFKGLSVVKLLDLILEIGLLMAINI